MLSRKSGDANKRRLFLALYHVTALEDGFKTEAYHWTLLLAPKDEKNGSAADWRRYHITDLLGVKRVPWYFEQRMANEGVQQPQEVLICRLQLGKVRESDFGRMEQTLGDTRRLFESDKSGYFSCRIWTKAAVAALQEAQLVQSAAVLDAANLEWEAKNLAREAEKSRQYGKVDMYKGQGDWGFVC